MMYGKKYAPECQLFEKDLLMPKRTLSTFDFGCFQRPHMEKLTAELTY